MIRRAHGQHRFESTHIDMVPMVDCIMVLVIFLMVSSSFVNDPGVEVQKPDVVGALSSEQNALLIAIAADNRIWFDGQEIRTDQVATVLKQAAVGRSPSLIVRGDQASSLGVFAQVYTEAKRAGIKQVQFATARTEGP
ncbi:biopolymer transporter ExbD [Oleiharenicola lentus]|jgi:biopolymer transport protein ExbD|uniref:Biopolymer transporter ExbD n=1 Tax=Oleiharenicola lentus TaxID=2508720 RepID=A0A4Q1C5K8_9BACT|nr:biopolymer transporter ExbD [Oleiharenicola lentus]RXK53718.1 biopolymer transporter ExbD [Oleiharenicola lentus]